MITAFRKVRGREPKITAEFRTSKKSFLSSDQKETKHSEVSPSNPDEEEHQDILCPEDQAEINWIINALGRPRQ